jgi:hypothetical protein
MFISRTKRWIVIPIGYLVRRTLAAPALDGEWDGQDWQRAETLEISHFRPESSAHHPHTLARLLHDGTAIYVFFHVEDRYVRSVQTQYLGPVCTDSCVEWFARPRLDRGYINFELNCGGTLHSSYIEDPTRVPGGFKRFTYVDEQWARQVQIVHSMPAVVEPEIASPCTWTVAYRVPLALFEAYTGPLGELSGQVWQANFYKCGDQTSHPHWVAWAPVQELNFHRPQDFAAIRFE